ncbi:hypothetical protein ACNF40_08735 [Cuniculiplasma sp. SKW4]|uniref:hypothetical protein n=1 Tax=Cuniculiplasma sp. SKW4 TaxID=3400171 RepID=UPI003FD50B78
MPFKDKEKMREYMRKYRSKKVNTVNVNPIVNTKSSENTEILKKKENDNPVNRKPVNPEKYLLSYSRNKYQFVLYSIGENGEKRLIKSLKKNEIINFKNSQVQLTWGPEV